MHVPNLNQPATPAVPATQQQLFTKRTNILDPIHDKLDPTVFDDPGTPSPKLKERHAKWIKETIFRTLDNHGYDGMEDWLHLVFTGSLTTYQYSDESDVDISLFVNAEKFPEWSRAEMIAVMVNNIDGTKLPGTVHIMQCFVIPPDVKQEDLYQPGMRSGWDIDEAKWIVPPERNRVVDVQAEQNAAYVYALQTADKMERLLRYEPDKAVTFWHQIHKRRQRDMRGGKGDFADSNIAYKMLANRGLFPQISEVSGEYIARTSAILTSDGWQGFDTQEAQAQDGGWSFRQGEAPQAPTGDEEAQVEPYFPGVEEAVEANQAALEAAGQTNNHLLRPDVLEGALGRAANHYYYGGDMAASAASIAHGVGQAQAFEDGNKRAAYWLTHHFLHENDLSHAAPDDDVELADHLIGYGEGTHAMEDTAELLRQRIGKQSKVAIDMVQPFNAPSEQPTHMKIDADGCQYCGATLSPVDPVCPQCGRPTAPQQSTEWQNFPQMINQPVAKTAEYDAPIGQRWIIDNVAIRRAADDLGLQKPVVVERVNGHQGFYKDLGDKHYIGVVGWLKPEKASNQIWHELEHARQAEQEGPLPERPEDFQEYRNMPTEQQAREFADQAPFDLVHSTSKVANPKRKQRDTRKFVYNAAENRVVIGELGPEEGALPNHEQLASQFQDGEATHLGIISPSGWAQFEGSSKNSSPQTRYLAQEAIREALGDQLQGFIGREETNLWAFGHAGASTQRSDARSVARQRAGSADVSRTS